MPRASSGLAFALLAFACGGERSIAAGAVGTKATQEPEVAILYPAPAGDESAYGSQCRLRSMPLREAVTPSKHYRMSGEITFSFPESEREEVLQSCLLSLGGADRIRYTLRAGGQRSVFLLQGEQAWRRSTGDPAYAPIESDEWRRTTWLRWNAARFPWDWSRELDGPPRQSYALEAPFGAVEVRLDRDGRPAAWVYEGGSLELRDYVALKSGVWMPATWTWKEAALVRTERFDEIYDGVLFLDEAFRPRDESAPSEGWGLLTMRPGERRQTASDLIGLVQRPSAEILEGPVEGVWLAKLAAQGVVREVAWLRIEGGRVVARAALLQGEAPATLPSGVRKSVLPAGSYLRWISFGRQEPSEADAAMRAAAERNRLRVEGPVWVQAVAPSPVPQAQEILIRAER